MKRLKYIYALLIAALLGIAISSCKDDEASVAEEEATGASYSGEMVKVNFTVGVSAPDVSGDSDVETRALDNANTDFAKPENGGRFTNVVVVLVGPCENETGKEKVYGIHCKKFENSAGVKDYFVTFSDIEIPSADVEAKKTYKVYAFGNICNEHYADIVANDASRNFGVNHVDVDNLDVYKYCINSSITLDDGSGKTGNIYNSYHSNINIKDIPQYNINFSPGTSYLMTCNYSTSTVTSTGMPENQFATATVVRGNTYFNVAMKRVCARLKITFRNRTGQYMDASNLLKDNNIYIDEFKTSNLFATSTNYLYKKFENNNYSGAGSPFDILQHLECKDGDGKTASDHVHNKIENGQSLTVSIYVFDTNLNGGCTYDMKIDRGKSLGNRAGNLQEGNVYVMWSDVLDKGVNAGTKVFPFYVQNDFTRCLGASGNTIIFDERLKYGTDIDGNEFNILPFGDYQYGNRIFWKFTDGKFENCNVDLATDECVGTDYFINKNQNSGIGNEVYSTGLVKGINNAQKFTEVNGDAFTPARKRLKISNNHYLQISKNLLYDRYITGNSTNKDAYPWVFFAKYIIKTGQKLGEGKVSSNSEATQLDHLERNHNYELEFTVLPNYDDKEELLVSCVRKQNEIEWEEVQK